MTPLIAYPAALGAAVLLGGCASEVKPRASDAVRGFAQSASDKQVAGCARLTDFYAYAFPGRKNRALALFWAEQAMKRDLEFDASFAGEMDAISGASDEIKRDAAKIALSTNPLLNDCVKGEEL
ncbi:MAG: hypothetical protein AAFX02_09835 [Pseudomonadota bacterium]